MPEHIKLTSPNDWPQWFLLHALVEAKQKGLEVPSIPEGGLMVTLTINGIECPVLDTLRYLEQQHDDMIRRKALAYLQEQIDVQMSSIWDLFKAFRSGIKDKLIAAGIEVPEEG